MQRFLFLFVLVVFSACQNLDTKDSGQSIGQLLNTYHRLPAHYQRLNLSELLYLKPLAQKVRLKQDLEFAERRRRSDSLLFNLLGKPISNFYTSCLGWTEQPSLTSDSVEILVIYSHALTTNTEVHYLGPSEFLYKHFVIDAQCNPQTGSKPLTIKCLTSISEKKLPSKDGQLATLKDYLNKCDFLSGPARYDTGCMDGDYITIYVKNGNSYKVASAHCPGELQPMRLILNKARSILNEN